MGRDRDPRAEACRAAPARSPEEGTTVIARLFVGAAILYFAVAKWVDFRTGLDLLVFDAKHGFTVEAVSAPLPDSSRRRR